MTSHPLPSGKGWLRPAAAPALLLALLSGILLAGCAKPPPQTLQTVQAVPAGEIELAVIARDWHTELAIPAARIAGPLAQLRPLPAHPSYVIVGFGDKAYFTDHDAGFGSAFAALFPGPSAVQLAAYNQIPEDAQHRVIRFHVSQAAIDRLADFIWASMAKARENGQPLEVAEHDNDSLFYAGARDYDGLYNCNSWTAEALQKAGFDVDPSGVWFAHEVMDQVEAIKKTDEVSRR